MKKVMSKLYLFMLVAMLMMSFATTVFATDLDNLNSGQTSTNGSNQSGQSSDSHNGSITDYLQGYTPVTDENMSNAKQYASPITNALGTLTGFIVMIVSAGIFVVTALDLAYIGLPFTRSLLNPQQAQQQGGGMGMSPMGGMGGMRGGMMGGGMMGGGAQGQSQEYGMHRRWVSDEAVNCVALANPQPQGGGMGMSPMGGMGGMGMGGGMMGGMGGQQQQPMPTKSVIMMYLKKRTFFLIVFAVAMILLTSSIFTDCGINLAELSFKIIDKFNSIISGVNV